LISDPINANESIEHLKELQSPSVNNALEYDNLHPSQSTEYFFKEVETAGMTLDKFLDGHKKGRSLLWNFAAMGDGVEKNSKGCWYISPWEKPLFQTLYYKECIIGWRKCYFTERVQPFHQFPFYLDLDFPGKREYRRFLKANSFGSPLQFER
jgi:hypothetical protein